MTAPNTFRPGRTQDAHAVIRGFRYQIDHTLIRWMTLGPDEHLELECGEDIDLVGRAIGGDSDENFERTLEQIKLRSDKLTLRSESALEVLANAVSHLQSNPTLRLRFCYTTNAVATRERPCPFPNKLSGIALWDNLRSEILSDEQRAQALQSLRQFLIVAARPKKTTAPVWSQFVEFIRTTTESQLEIFVRTFEWSCGKPDVAELSDLVRNELRRRGIDADQLEAMYQRIFFFVFRLLTQPILKRLTTASLEEQFRVPTLSEADQVLLSRLQSRFDVLENRVGDIEQSVAVISEDVQRLAIQYRVANAQIDSIGLTTIDAPPLVQALSCRDTTVEKLLKQGAGKTWFAIHGLSDTGKTHLAALVTKANGGCCAWLRFQCSMSEERALMILKESLRRISRLQANEDIQGTVLYEEICDKLQPGSCLVLDDLPNLVGTRKLTEQLQNLMEACRAKNVLLLSTSHFRLPTNLATSLDANLYEIPVPPFSDSEARDILASYGASDRFLQDNVVRFINGLSSGHPLLLTHAARFLKERSWHLDNDEFSGLLRGDHSTRIGDDVLLRVCQSLDTQQRELLYRLTLVIGSITEVDALQLAGVDEPVDRPRERLVGLIGAWVQRDTAQNLIVSPLVRDLGKGNLAPATFVKCHAVLGEIITQKSMSPWDAEIAVMHFLQAREFDRAGVLWLMLLSEFRSRKVVPELRSILSFWCGVPLPVEMSLGLRLKIRAMQFWVLPRYEKALEPVLSDLDRLMEQIGPAEAHSAHFLGSLAALFLAKTDFTRATRYLTKSIEVLRGSSIKRSELVLPRGKTHVELLWTLIINIRNQKDLKNWIEAFRSLTSDEQEIVMNSKDAVLGRCVLADQLMLIEMKRPATEQQWNRVLTETLWLQQTATELEWEDLEAAVRKSVINIQGEFLKAPAKCEASVRAYVDHASVSTSNKGLVSGMLGKMFAGASQHRQAMPWLKIAIEAPDVGLPHDRMMTLLAAAKSISSENQEEAIQYAGAAAEIARTSKHIPDLEASKALGEWTIALAGTTATREAALRAYPAWNETANRLFHIRERDHEWKEILALFGHVNSYLVRLATDGRPPEETADGEEYLAPRQGMFLTSHPQRASLFRDESVPTVMWLLSQYARKAGDEMSARSWMRRAGNEIEGQPVTFISATIARDLVPQFLQVSSFDDALSASLRGAQALVAQKEVLSKRTTSRDLSIPLDPIVAKMSPDALRTADRFSLILGVLPALLNVITVALRERERALDDARQLAALCRQTALSSSNATIWTGAASVFEAVENGKNHQAFFKLSQSFSGEEDMELRVLAYLASTTTATAEPAFQAQLACLRQVLIWYPVDSAIYAQIVLPYFESYWLTMLQLSRFQFSSPRLVESQLSAAMSSDPRDRVRAILIALLPAFRTTGFEKQVRGLRATDASSGS